MPSAAQIQFYLLQFFQVVSILGFVLTAYKLYSSGLSKRYRILFVYFIFGAPYMLAAWLLDQRSNAYLRFFLFTEPIVMIFNILIVLELYGLVLERYKGLYTLGRWAMYLSMFISTGISLFSILPTLTKGLSRTKLVTMITIEGGLDLSLVIFILLIILFLGRYPVPLSRNVLVHTIVFSAYFLSNTLGLVIRRYLGINLTVSVNTALIGVSSACAVAWWLCLTAKGEEVVIHAPVLAPGSEQRILQQLDAMNATLLKVSRN